MKNLQGLAGTFYVLLLSALFLSGCGPMALGVMGGLEQNRVKMCKEKEGELRSKKGVKEIDVKYGMIDAGCRDFYTASK